MSPEPRSVPVTIFIKDSEGYVGQDDITELPAITIQAPETRRLRELVAEAYVATNRPPPEYFNVHLVSKPDQDGQRRIVPDPAALVGQDGTFFWRVGVGSAEATVGDVRRTRDEGLTVADPHAYGADLGGYGDHLLPGWDAMFDFLEGVGGAGGGAVLIWETARGLLKVTKRHYDRWRGRHARAPMNFFSAIVTQRSWSLSRLSRLLDVEEEEAAQLLLALGYERQESGDFLWSSDRDKSRLRRMLAEQEFLWGEFDEGEDDYDD